MWNGSEWSAAVSWARESARCAPASILDVRMHEVDAAAVERGRKRIEHSLSRAVASGRLTEQEGAAALQRISFTTDLGDLADRQLVIEAVTEDEQAKLAVFSVLDKVLEDEDAILASNTSSIPIMKLAMATSRPEKVIGLHFFNPAPVLRLVELVSSLLTSAETAEVARAFASDQLGKRVISSKDRAGFIVNALLIPYILSAIRMLESGFATSEDIDAGNGRGLRPSDGTLGSGRPDRDRHDASRGRVPLRGVQGAAVRPAAAPFPHGGSGLARSEVGPGLLHVPGLRA